MSVIAIPSAFPDFTGLTIDEGRLRLVEIIGEGAHGVVYRAIEESSAGSSSAPSPKEYAVKVQPKADETSRQGMAQAREIITHKIASEHPNVVTLHHVVEEDWFLFLVTDYCPGGDLFRVVIEDPIYARRDDMVKNTFLQMLDAVEYIHDKGIYHRDLKPDNIFVNADATEIYVGDFGLATDISRGQGFGCGTTSYISPECIGMDFNYMPFDTAKADIWSLGIILITMMTGRHPWRVATTDDEHFVRYLEDENALLQALPISTGANEIIKRILTFNPNRRISIAELREEIKALDTFFMTDEEIANSNELVQEAAAIYFPRALGDADKREAAEDAVQIAMAGREDISYPSLDPGDAYAFVRPDHLALSPRPGVLSESVVFTIGSVSDGTVSSPSSGGSNTDSSGRDSTGPRTPDVPAVDDKQVVPQTTQDAFEFPARAAEPQKGPTPIHCLVQGIEEISLIVV
ncbi:serine/threonine protein kinase, negative regulator of sexual conjugation and meiosis [Cristinia sonorae]|uniref:Serine/threonine protein kinase, negative regulator of sexual conjugation and meiosis n=1 Tax=Cristinia sonorae TaxID=1940300 RepID=A0A8K0UF16_9AGAR|nr:serine/threonine protein kinase, negative regulator of sexual conjugation and meiosis [Cristinia sonorae]